MTTRKRNIKNKVNTSSDTTKAKTSTTKTKINKIKNEENKKNLKFLLVFIITFLTFVGGSIFYLKLYQSDSKTVKLLLPFLSSKTEDNFIFSNVSGITPPFYENSSYNLVKNYGPDPSIHSCLHRKLVVDKHGNQRDLVKTDHKCIDGMMNEWHIKKKGKFYSIISDYDGKCLNYSKDGSLYMQKCDKYNKFENFIIKNNGVDCSQLGVTNCIDFSIIPFPIIPERYKNLNCSINFARLGIKCCSKDTKIEYVDQIGNWGIENDELCGIGYARCSFEIIGYPCCTSLNPEVVSTDENGSWGYEDGEKCGIG